jgi:hypothetical protein
MPSVNAQPASEIGLAPLVVQLDVLELSCRIACWYMISLITMSRIRRGALDAPNVLREEIERIGPVGRPSEGPARLHGAVPQGVDHADRLGLAPRVAAVT